MIWTYREQRADKADPVDHLLPPPASADGCWAVEKFAMLGTFVDGSDSALYGHPVHALAEAVHEVVSLLVRRDVAELLIRQARAATRPECFRHARQRLVPVAWVRRRGKRVPLIEYAEDTAPFCPLMLTERPEMVAAARARYSLWHAGLALVGELLRPRLRLIRVTGPAAPAQPWASQNAIES